MKFLSYILLICLCSILNSCQTIISHSQTEIIVKKGHGVSAFDSQMSFLNLYAPNMSIIDKLVKSCPGGIVSGVETTLLKREFLLFQIYDLNAKASCQGAIQ